jgi:hypothetical protein
MLRVDRLQDVAVEARLFAALFDVRVTVAGECKEQVRRQRLLSQNIGHSETIHARHGQIQQDQVRLMLSCHLDTRCSIIAAERIAVEQFQKHYQHIVGISIVFYNERANTLLIELRHSFQSLVLGVAGTTLDLASELEVTAK